MLDKYHQIKVRLALPPSLVHEPLGILASLFEVAPKLLHTGWQLKGQGGPSRNTTK